jgi:hypothetical protein
MILLFSLLMKHVNLNLLPECFAECLSCCLNLPLVCDIDSSLWHYVGSDLFFSLVKCCLVGSLNGPRYAGMPAPAFELQLCRLLLHLPVEVLLLVILLLCSLNEHLPSAPVDKCKS